MSKTRNQAFHAEHRACQKSRLVRGGTIRIPATIHMLHASLAAMPRATLREVGPEEALF